MKNNKTIKLLLLLLITCLSVSINCNAQTDFTERLAVYYDINTPKNDSLYEEIMRDTIINKGSYSELMAFVDSTNLLYQDTLVSVYLIYKMGSDSFRKSIGLSNQGKIKILSFLSTILLDVDMKKTNYKNIPDALFDYNFWGTFGRCNDSIQYDANLRNSLKQVVKYKSEYLMPWAVQLFYECHLEDLFLDVIQYAIKPNFEMSYTKTNNNIWSHIYYLAKTNNKDVLPYLYKAVVESGCNCSFYDNKYQEIFSLLYTIDNIKVKKNILFNLLKDDCLFKLYTPTITRNEISVPYFNFLILDFLKQYETFPIEKVQKLSEKKQVEFVKSWIEKNM